MAQALQGFGIDGRRVRRIRLQAWLKGENLRPGRTATEQPGMVILFYGENREEVGTAFFGPFLGTFPWTQRSVILPVPMQAREAIIRIGLLGGTGTLAVDAIRLEPVGPGTSRK